MTGTSTTERTPAPQHGRVQSLPATAAEAIERARVLRPLIAATGARIDAAGEDPTEAMDLIAAAGLMALVVPVELGGLAEQPGHGDIRALFEIYVELAAGDGSVGQVWGQSSGMAALLLTPGTLPAQTGAVLAHELLHEGRRLIGSTASAGTGSTTVIRRVEGGVVIAGVKSFNTGSGAGGRDIAVVTGGLEEADGQPTPYRALVRLDAAGVQAAHDWDTMGQRGTYSQTITYRDVFVPDGWHGPFTPPFPLFLAFARGMMAAVLQGIGEGALEAGLATVRELDRPGVPMFGTAVDDPFLHRRLGESAARLAASRALVLAVGEAITTAAPIADPTPATVLGMHSVVMAAETALAVSGEVHTLTGARSTANRHRLDRFWRNARTLSTHDFLDGSTALVGKLLLTGEMPSFGDYFRMG
jgi:alkylation response protein AidB-like acyl-CoA dehydrogenase